MEQNDPQKGKSVPRLWKILVYVSLTSLACTEKTPSKAPPKKEAPSPQNNTGDGGTSSLPDYGSGSDRLYDDDDDEDEFSSGTGKCSKSSCPQADIDIEVNGVNSRSLQVRIGQSVDWTFRAKSDRYPEREFEVFRIEIQTRTNAIRVEDNNAKNPRVVWVPKSQDPKRGGLEVTARDLTACNMQEEDNDCNDFSKDFGRYDETQAFQWDIVDANLDSRGSFGSRVMLGAGIGALSGLMTNGGMGGVFNSALNGVLGSLGAGIFGGGLVGLNGGLTAFGTNCGMYNAFQCRSIPSCQWNGISCTNSLTGFGTDCSRYGEMRCRSINSCLWDGIRCLNGVMGATGNCSRFNQIQCRSVPNCRWDGLRCVNGMVSGSSTCSGLSQFRCQSSMSNCRWDGMRCTSGFSSIGTNCISFTQNRCRSATNCRWNGIQCVSNL